MAESAMTRNKRHRQQLMLTGKCIGMMSMDLSSTIQLIGGKLLLKKEIEKHKKIHLAEDRLESTHQKKVFFLLIKRFLFLLISVPYLSTQISTHRLLTEVL